MDSDQQAGVLQSIIDQINLDQKPRLVAQRIRLSRWYESASDLLSLAAEAFNDGVQELRSRHVY